MAIGQCGSYFLTMLLLVTCIVSVVSIASGQVSVLDPGVGSLGLHSGGLGRGSSCARFGCRHDEVCVTSRRQNVCSRSLPRFLRRSCYCQPGCLLEDGSHADIFQGGVPHQGQFIPEACTFLVGCRRVCTCHNGHFDCARLSRPRRRRCRQRRRQDSLFHGIEDDIRSQCYPHGLPHGRRPFIGVDPVIRRPGGTIGGLGGSGIGSVIGGLLGGLGK